MIKPWVSIFLGVISGVITTSLLCVIKSLFRNNIIPWYEAVLYKGIILSGRWKNEEQKFLEIILELTQSGYRISGSFCAKSKSNGETVYDNFYNISGYVNDNYVMLRYAPISRKRTGLGSFVLRVKKGGKQMVGNVSFVDEVSMDISALQITLNRQSD